MDPPSPIHELDLIVIRGLCIEKDVWLLSRLRPQTPRVVEPPGPRLPGTGAIAPCPGRCTCPPAFIAFVPSRNRNARTMHGSGFLLEGKIVNENTKKREVPEKGNQALKNLTYHNNFGGQLPIQLSSCWPHFRYYHFFLKKKIQIQFLL